jgi:hypothetical protein
VLINSGCDDDGDISLFLFDGGLSQARRFRRSFITEKQQNWKLILFLMYLVGLFLIIFLIRIVAKTRS